MNQEHRHASSASAQYIPRLHPRQNPSIPNPIIDTQEIRIYEADAGVKSVFCAELCEGVLRVEAQPVLV